MDRAQGAIFGIDVSHWQGDIDWSKARQYDVAFVIMKVSQGRTMVDPRFRDYDRACGLPTGYYHFLGTGDAAGAVEEAEHFLRQLEGRPAPMGCWLDCEAASLERWGRAALTAAANAFLQRVEAAADRNGARYRGGVYCNRNWARNFLDLKDPAWPASASGMPARCRPARRRRTPAVRRTCGSSRSATGCGAW